ncbi:LacI family transcriptional regulator [Sphaerisporangium rufum]|uniref:LacI family transcriptional regulator n=1 Tax=Sphaerisporangium rufum TaxID=1381558 RepID=A0A919QXV7_9ACTN|nr:LacI family DNA-binding transcriptional regulator [Sphaerisporangium rufum]GII75843.1 LacI family transcriptional regulator [Sphaerisporangium rufum]
MGKRPTIADVARLAGVSRGTVSFALNGRPGVGADTRERVLAAAAELDWTPSRRARSLAASRAFALGLVIARPPQLLGADPFFPTFIAGVESVLAERGHILVLQVVLSAAAETEGYRNLARDGRVDGVFLTDLRHADPRIELLAELGLPAVTLNRPDVPSPFPAVGLDDHAGVEAAVRHLAGLGHTRIAHVAGPAHFLHGAGRAAAWRAALAAAGLPPGPLAEADFSAAGGAAATRELLAARPRPTAIVYANDLMAIAGLTAARAMGLSVPDELSVTGFDDCELAEHVHPPLTTVTMDVFGWGVRAATALLDLVDGAAVPDAALPPARLVVRGSTAPAR